MTSIRGLGENRICDLNCSSYRFCLLPVRFPGESQGQNVVVIHNEWHPRSAMGETGEIVDPWVRSGCEDDVSRGASIYPDAWIGRLKLRPVLTYLVDDLVPD